MKNGNYLLFAFIAIIVFGCSTKNNDVIITGIIKGNIPERVFYSYPVNETNFWNFTRSVTPDSLGNFTIRMLTEKPAFVNIFTKSNPVIIVEPNGKYEIEIDLALDEEKYSIKSNLEIIQNFYSSLPKINPRTCPYFSEEDIRDIDEKVLEIKKDLQFEIGEIEKIYNNTGISKELIELIILDREIYYSTAQMSLASRNWIANIQKTLVIPAKVFKIWEDVAVSISLEDENLFRTNFFYDYLDTYFWYKAYTIYERDSFNKLRADLRGKGKIHSHSMELARQFFENGKVLEFYSAAYIHLNSFNESKDIISCYENFVLEYPESKYNEFLSPVFEFKKQKE